jgi:hypothetical protein
MQTASSGHGLRPWSGKASAQVQPSQINAAETRKLGSKDRGRSSVSGHERLLLASVLLVVAGWIIFRVLLTMLTLD